MWVTVPVEARQPSAGTKRTSISCAPGASVSAGNETASSTTSTEVPTLDPSTHSWAEPCAGASVSPAMVADTVSGVPNGDGEAGATATVVVVRRAAPSSYIAATSAAVSVEV